MLIELVVMAALTQANPSTPPAPAAAPAAPAKAPEAAKPAEAAKPGEPTTITTTTTTTTTTTVAPPKTAVPPAKPAEPAKEEKAEKKTAPVFAKLPSGLEIEDLVVGTGYEVKAGGAVIAHSKGTLKSDGSEFDSSFKRGEPTGFPLTGVIKGWQEGVPGMKVGGKRKLTVPAAMAYGEREIKNGDKVIIPKNSDLVFEIEIVNALQIEDIKLGDGAECKPGATVKLHYTGTLKDGGKQFDSSVGGPPAEFPLGQLIRGWQFGVPGMKVGGKRKLTIPWQFGYGAAGSPPNIPGKADLVFDIELLDTK